MRFGFAFALGGLIQARIRAFFALRRRADGALDITVHAPTVTATRDPSGRLVLTVQE